MSDLKDSLSLIKEELEKESFVEELYRKKKEIEDKRFGKVIVWTKKTGEDVILHKEMSAKNIKICKMIVKNAQERLRLNHDYIMKMVDFSVKVEAKDSFKIWGFYQAPMQDLKKEIARRQLAKK